MFKGLNLGASISWNPQGLFRPVMRLLYLFCLEAECLTGDVNKTCLSLVPMFMIYDKHDSTFRCKYLAGYNVGRRRRWSEEERGGFLVHLPRPLKGCKRHETIYGGEGLRPEVPVPPRVIVGM